MRIWSPRAASDLVAIWEYFAHAASEAIADDEPRAIDRATTTLEDWPDIGKARDDERPGLRSVRADRHIVYYRARSGIVEIAHMLDERRNVEPLFSGD